MQNLIDVPAGLNGVAVAETEIGNVLGDEGFYHYRQYDATELARTVGLEDVWYLLDRGELPTAGERAGFSAEIAGYRQVPPALHGVVDAVAAAGGAPLAQLRSVLSSASLSLGLEPMLDLGAAERRQQALRLAACIPAVLGRLYRRGLGLAPVVSRRRPRSRRLLPARGDGSGAE